MYTLSKDVRISQFRIYEGEFPDRLRSARQQYQNMFEIPILFYLLCLLNIFFNNYTQFDTILAFGLYHNFQIDMFEKALDETKRILKDDGLLCFSFRSDNIQNYIMKYLSIENQLFITILSKLQN